MKIQQLKLLNDGANIKVVYPKEGTVFYLLVLSLKSQKHGKCQEIYRFSSLSEIQDKLGTNHY